MTTRQRAWAGGTGLLVVAVGIWLRDTQWQQFPADALPLIAGLPLIALLGGPWKVATTASRISRIAVAAGSALLGLGWMIGMTTPMAAGWAILLGCWMKACFEAHPRRGRLVWIGLLSFPWLTLDWPMIGWGFRLTAAKFATLVFSLLSLPVSRDGTNFEVVGMPVEVQQACAGWNLLQLSLLTGLAMGTMELGRTSRFAVLLLSLPVIAWLANAIRILLLAAAGLTWGTAVADGPLHLVTGLLVLGIVLMSTRVLGDFLEPRAIIRREVS